MTSENTQIDFFAATKDAWDSMYRDCEKAQKSIEFEQYILMDDTAGHRFLVLFAEKARAGIRVNLLLDAFGSRNLRGSSLIADILKAGGRVYFYRKVSLLTLLTPLKWFPRNHNKILLIDGEIGYIGSVCLADEMREWHDMHARFTGDLAKDVAIDFELVWQHIKERKKLPSFYYKQDQESDFSYVASRQVKGPRHIYRILLAQIKRSRHCICLVTPYFLPPFRLRHALKRAVRRGVSVKIMISQKTDVKPADFISRAHYLKLLKAGIRIFQYKKTVLHAKYVMIDDTWATVGSTNMDYLSLLHNHESNIVIRDPEAVKRLYAQFEEDMQQCDEARIDYYRSLSPLYKIVEYMGRGFRWLIER